MNKLFEAAFNKFLLDERSLISSDASERALCTRLAMKIEEMKTSAGLVGYYADADYNRKQGGQVKTIIGDDLAVITIVADVLLHSRGEIAGRDNLIAIEMKKRNRPQNDKDSDRRRLIAMTKSSYDDIWSADGKTLPEHVCGYELGVFLEIDVNAMRAIVEYYALGKYVGETELAF